MSQQSVLPALLQKAVPPLFPSSPSFLICYHLSLSLSSLPHLHYPPPSFICIFCSYISSLPSWWWSRGPDLVVLGFQMVWLADGSELTSRQLILSYLKPPGVLWEGRHFSSKLRGRGQERDRGLWENCITAEPVIYCISSSNSLRLGFFLVLFFQSACTSELFEAQAHTLCYHSSAV